MKKGTTLQSNLLKSKTKLQSYLKTQIQTYLPCFNEHYRLIRITRSLACTRSNTLRDTNKFNSNLDVKECPCLLYM